MTRKELILRMIQKLPDDVTYDRVMYHLDVMKAVEQGTEDVKQGRVIDHDELFDRLLREDAQDKDYLERAVGARSARDSKVHPKRSSAKDSKRVHPPPPKRRSKA